MPTTSTPRFTHRCWYRLIALVLLWPCWPAAAPAAEPAPTAPEWLHALRRDGEDDPRQTLAEVERRLAQSPEPASRFWLQLVAARMRSAQEDMAGARQAFSQAESTLKAMQAPGPHLALWLQLERSAIDFEEMDHQRYAQRMVQLRARVNQVGDPMLTCSFVGWEQWGLLAMYSADDAWIVSEELEHCGRATGLKFLESLALSGMGLIKAATLPKEEAAPQVLQLFDRARALLDDGRSRWRLANTEFDMGTALRGLRQYGPALEHLQQAHRLFKALNDRAGVGLVDEAMARTLLAQGEHAAMLPWLDEAQQLQGAYSVRMPFLAELRVRALARMKRPEVLAEIERARHWDQQAKLQRSRIPLAKAFAEGYASQGQYQRAHAELLRAEELEAENKRQIVDTQVLRLQARYDSARRDAENAELRHRSEATQLALKAQLAERRALWLAVATLALLAGGIGLAARRSVVRHRALADLALRDELSGCPNRRAVTAYVQAQFSLARRLNLPLTVAMIDLDHFKRVNDTHGHAAGDALLRAFAQAIQSTLRGHDRLGRWGGEEWLLVMPGTTLDELPPVFERMRSAYATAAVAGLPSPHGGTFSMGAASAGSDTPSVERLIALADERLYTAKAGGRNALCTGDAALPGDPAATA